jgi:FkbM family methyltransferase
VVDVGVADGTPELDRQFPKARHLLVEPLREWEPALRTIARAYDAQYVIAAAGERAGITTIHVHEDLSGSSLLQEVKGGLAVGIPREVAVATIDSLCQERRLEGPYLIKVDVQGSELKVLTGARRTLGDTELVILEVSLFQFFVGGPQFFDVVTAMKDWRFAAYDICGGHCRPLDGALAQVDVAFVKEHGLFRNNHAYDTAQPLVEVRPGRGGAR